MACTVGIEDIPSYEDDIFQECRIINEINIRFSEINASITKIQLDEQHIGQLQYQCINVGQALIQNYALKINIKPHRLMLHVKSQLTYFGRMI